MDKKTLSEASHFNDRDMELRRKVSWSRLAAPYVSEALYKKGTLNDFLRKAGVSGKPGLSLACGDMRAEAPFFKLMECPEVDAYDVSDESLKRAQKLCADMGLKANITVQDVNKVKLPKKKYGLVVLSHAYHHLDEIDDIAKQIADSLLPNGVFVLIDYVGPKNIQFTPQQLKHANEFFKTMPASLRTDRTGKALDGVHPPLRWGLSAHEAMQSPKILNAVESNFSCIKGLLYGGLMHPVLERVSGSFDAEKPAHAKILDKLWKLDRELIDSGEVEPNFCEMVLVRKDSPVLKKYPAKWFKYRALERDERYEWLVDTSSEEIWRLRGKITDLHATVDKYKKQLIKVQTPPQKPKRKVSNIVKRITTKISRQTNKYII